MLAESYQLAGDLAAASAHLTAARAHRESHGENYVAAEIYRLAASLSLTEGASSEVTERHLKEGLGIAREQAARLPELRCATMLAKLWSEQGRRVEARDLLNPSMAGSPKRLILPICRRPRACSMHWHESEV